MGRPPAERCPQGHEYTPENSYPHPTRGGRVCRLCHRQQNRDWARENRRKIKAAMADGLESPRT